MSHKTKINDKDPCFEIDQITRAIRNVSASKTTIMQYDHNSERFTFVLPKTIEGHEMMECNKVEVHYTNGTNQGIYTVTDLQPDPENESKLKCSWLLSQNSTKTSGALVFLLRFSCVANDGTIEYAWNTAPYAGISVSSGLYNTDIIVEQYADVLEQWKQELEGSVGGSGGGAVASVNGKTGAVVLSASDVGAYTINEAKEFTDSSIMSHYNVVVLPAIENRADNTLSNVSNEAFLTKLNEVLPDGDEVSY
jgi:hypothetical protein